MDNLNLRLGADLDSNAAGRSVSVLTVTSSLSLVGTEQNKKGVKVER